MATAREHRAPHGHNVALPPKLHDLFLRLAMAPSRPINNASNKFNSDAAPILRSRIRARSQLARPLAI